MATISRVLSQLTQNGWSEQDINDVDTRRVVRNFFKPNTVYGGVNDNSGRFEACKIGIIIKDNDKETRKLIWAVCYIVKQKDEQNNDVDCVQDALTKSFLLSNGRYDVDNNHIKALGDVREWADLNIVNNVLEREWSAKLAELLNARGLILSRQEYKQPKKDGTWFEAHIDHPNFADTFKAE